MMQEGQSVAPITPEVRSDLHQWRMDKTAFSVVDLEAESDEKTYWIAQTPKARLEALEMLRQVMYGYDPATARLQRVLEIVERPWG
jgi:hypothetical protein